MVLGGFGGFGGVRKGFQNLGISGILGVWVLGLRVLAFSDLGF